MAFHVTKGGSRALQLTIKRSLCLLIVFASVILLAACHTDADARNREETEKLFALVKDNRSQILEDIASGDYTRTLSLIDSGRTARATHVGECVAFYCYGLGFGPSTAYIGFYYTPYDGPAPVDMKPWERYFSAEGEDLIKYLTPEGDGWVWDEKSVDSGGDNRYYTEKICDNFWYYRLDY